MLRHLAAAAVFVGLAIVWSFPLALHLSTHVPGAEATDNVNFLWNFWWMREALSSRALTFFFTPYLFAPFGTDLTLHTHTALPAFAAATVLNALPVLTTLNATILGGLFLNGLCAYLLARRSTHDDAAAIFAGLVFAGSPYIAAHLNGHFNLTHAWTIPLFILVMQRAVLGAHGAPASRGLQRAFPARWGGMERSGAERSGASESPGERSSTEPASGAEPRSSSTPWAIGAGVVLGATAYVDYYYVVYEVAFALCACTLAVRDWSFVSGDTTGQTRRASQIFAVLAAIDLAIIAGITATGGFDQTVAGVRIQARDVFNPLQALWVLIALAAFLRWRPRLAARPADPWRSKAAALGLVVTLAVALAVAAPIVWNGAGLLLRGEYVTQRYFWRNAPKGIDAATLVLGHPFHGLWGSGVRVMYGRFHIDSIEAGSWLGAPVVFALWAVVRLRRHPVVWYWTAIAIVFFVWALGPHLMAFGRNTGMILPQTVLRYIPIAANARIPGRAIVLVYLAVGILGAMALADWRRRSPQPGLILALALMTVAIDYLPAPFPIVEVDHPRIYDTLRARPEPGALLELPAGIRDSFTGRGFFDHRVLAYQMIHRRPIVGGVVSRLSPSVIGSYAADPLIDAVLTLSRPAGQIEMELRVAGAPPVARTLPDRSLARQLLLKNGVTFVMLNRETARRPLIDYVETVMPLTLIDSDGTRSLYEVQAE